MGLLQDQVCIVTGGAGSLGLASARRFCDEGAKLMLTDLKEADLARAAAGLPPDRVETFAADVTDAAAVKAMVARTVARFGKIDVVFSNAGIQGVVAPATAYPEDVFARVLDVHVKGAFYTCKYALPQMNDGGRIVITSSVVGATAAPGSIAYATAKHAQVGLMRTLAREVAGRGIRVNTLHPGPIDNEFQTEIERGIGKMAGIDGTAMLNQMIPLHRHARPEEVAGSALYLASSLSGFVTGARIMVDGGMTS